MKTILCIGLMLCYIDFEVNAEKYPALIFDRHTGYLIRVPKNPDVLSKPLFGHWEMACPVKGDEERKFSQKYSLHNEAMFVNVDSSLIFDKEFDGRECDESYKLSVAFSIETEKVEFGYEIYMPRDELFDLSVESYRKLCPLKNVRWLVSPKKQNLQTRFDLEKEFQLNGKPMQFLWITMFKIKLFGHSLREVTYEIHRNNINPMLPCQDYTLGESIFGHVNVDSLYSDQAQKQLFDKIILPRNLLEGACESGYKCLKKWLLIPSDQFQFETASSLVCSNMATIPIWSSIIEGIMQKIDKFLYALQQVSDTSLNILAGVSGILELPQERSSFPFAESIYKTPLKKLLPGNYKMIKLKEEEIIIEVPNLIYKFAYVRSLSQKLFGVLIVIYNDPYFKEPICDDKSEQLGWQEIKYEALISENPNRTPSKFVQVCAISKDLLKKFDLPTEKYAEVLPLSLKEFPSANPAKHVYAIENINLVEKISSRLKDMSTDPNKLPEFENGLPVKICRPNMLL